MLEKISRERAKELMKSERYQDMLKAYESKALEFNFAPSPSLVEEMKIKFFIEFYSNTYLRKYPDRVYTEETVSSSVVSAPKVSSDTISNDADKELAITDIDKKNVAELLKEGANLSESTDLISSNNVSVAELPENSDEILLTVSTNSCSVNDTEQSDNEGQDSTDINEEENLDEKASVTISDIANEVDEELPVTEDATYLSIDNAEALSSGASSSTTDKYPAVDTKLPFVRAVTLKFTSVWHSLGKMFHKTKPTGDAVLDTSDSSFVGDCNTIDYNVNDKVDYNVNDKGVNCTGEEASHNGPVFDVL